MSLAKLTAVSTKTLSLLLERQRLQTLPSYSANGSNANAVLNGSSLHYPQIKRNMVQLRVGILALEAKEGTTNEAAKLLRNQYDRMRGMLWEEERAEIPGLQAKEPSPSPSPSPEPVLPTAPTHTARDSLLSHPTFAPYTDDPEQGLGMEPPEPATMLQTQQLIMQDQDQQLDHLSHSINRQHHISLQINDELDVHHGLLQDLDADIDRTQGRLSNARRKLDRVAKGVKNNGSVVAIGALIFILLILIIRFKT
jgi:syntaxin 8